MGAPERRQQHCAALIGASNYTVGPKVVFNVLPPQS